MALDRVLHGGLKPRSFEQVRRDRESLRIGSEAPSDHLLPGAAGGGEPEVQVPATKQFARKRRSDPIFTVSMATALFVIQVGWVFALLWTVTWVFQ